MQHIFNQGWWRGVVASVFIAWTKLPYVGPG